MVELQPSKLAMGVRFPSPALHATTGNCQKTSGELPPVPVAVFSQARVVPQSYSRSVGCVRPLPANHLESPRLGADVAGVVRGGDSHRVLAEREPSALVGQLVRARIVGEGASLPSVQKEAYVTLRELCAVVGHRRLYHRRAVMGLARW